MAIIPKIFNPATKAWTFAGTTPVNLVGGGEEIGPQVLRYDGTVICFGGGGNNAIYNSSTTTWAAAPSFPSNSAGQLDCADAPACLLTNGKVLVMTSPGLFNTGAVFFEWDGTNLNSAPTNSDAAFDSSFYGSPMLMLLERVQVMFTDQSSNIYFYNSVGSPNSAWAPTITTAPANVAPGLSYTISGTQFNGLSQSSAYGDDEQNATNYPMIRITNNATSQVVYCREFNPSTMGICSGSTIVSTHFTVPSNIGAGPSTIQVVTNGIPSPAVAIVVGSNTITSLTLNPTSIGGNSTSVGTVTLAAAAPAGGWVVSLSTEYPASVSVPASITIAAGSTSGTFTITPKQFSNVFGCDIYASDSNSGKQATLTVVGDSLSSLAVSPTTIGGSQTATGTITLVSAAPPGGWLVKISDEYPNSISVQASVTVPAGATTATFTITTKPFLNNFSCDIYVADNTTGKQATLIVDGDSLSNLTLNPSTIASDTSSTATITLIRPAPPGGWVVTVSDQFPGSVSVPSTVTVPFGATSATFTVTSLKLSTNTFGCGVYISDGTTGKQATLTVTGDSLASLSFNPPSVVGGTPSTGTVTLAGPAPAGGWVVNLSTEYPSVDSVPATVTVPAGATSATFTITTKTTTTTYTCGVYAKDATSGKNANLTITP